MLRCSTVWMGPGVLRRLWGWCKKRLGMGETWLGVVVFTLRMKIWAFVPRQWGTAEG